MNQKDLHCGILNFKYIKEYRQSLFILSSSI